MNSEPTPPLPLPQSNQPPSTLYDELRESIAKNEQAIPIDEFFQDMQNLAAKLPTHHEKVSDLQDPEQSRPVIFGSCNIPIAELLSSKEIVEELAKMKGQSKDGRSNEDSIVWLSSETNRAEAGRWDRISFTLKRDQDDKFYWTIGGGRHRLATDILAGRASITADVISYNGCLAGELGQNEETRVKHMQVHDENSDKRRQNLNNGENRVVS